tara:strand:- start:5761 stop:6186 length:426 start_codon:yes stop_codon:yes gene_type:complete
MDFNTYQTKARQTAIYTNSMYPITSLMIEAAEAADLFVKPLLRGDDTKINREEVLSELGDVLWNLSNIAADQGIQLEEIAVYNIEKLESRKSRGVLKGSGDAERQMEELLLEAAPARRFKHVEAYTRRSRLIQRWKQKPKR